MENAGRIGLWVERDRGVPQLGGELRGVDSVHGNRQQHGAQKSHPLLLKNRNGIGLNVEDLLGRR
jgi:hypothetical protein